MSTKQHGQLLVENILQFWLEVKLNQLFFQLSLKAVFPNKKQLGECIETFFSSYNKLPDLIKFTCLKEP